MLPVYFKRILMRHGITDKCTHNMRHTFATRRAGLGESVDVIRRKMGHALPATTGRVHSLSNGWPTSLFQAPRTVT